jgi:hypothetical protein
MFLISFGELHPQVPKESKQILGNWTLLETKRNSKPVRSQKTEKVSFQIEGDSIDLLLEDRYGNYEPKLRFPKTPKRSGPNGLLYEWGSDEVDEDGDSLSVTHWVEFVDIKKKRVQISIGTLQRLKTESQGEYSSWSESFKEKWSNWNYGTSSTFTGQRAK